MTTAVSTQDIRTVAVATAAAVLLYASGFLVLFTPLPLFYAFVSRGRGIGIATSAAALMVVLLLYGAVLPWLSVKASGEDALMFALPGIGLIDTFSLGIAQFFGGAYFTFFLVVAVALGEGARKNLNVFKWVGYAVMAGMISIAAATVLAKFFGGGSVVSGIRGYMESVIAEIAELNKTAGVNDYRLYYLIQNGKEIASYLLYLLPSMLFVFVLLSVVLNMLVGRRIIRIPNAITRMRQTISFRLPDWLIWLVIGFGIAFFANSYLVGLNWVKFLALNGLIAVGSLYFFQGLAVLAFFLERMKLKVLRIAMYIAIIVFFQSVGLVLIGVGIADVWIDFREKAIRLAKKKDQV